ATGGCGRAARADAPDPVRPAPRGPRHRRGRAAARRWVRGVLHRGAEKPAEPDPVGRAARRLRGVRRDSLRGRVVTTLSALPLRWVVAPAPGVAGGATPA